MTLQTFREVLAERPFKPFRLVMSRGMTYEVCRREMVFLTQTSLVVGVGDPGDGVPAEFKICALGEVVAIESIA